MQLMLHNTMTVNLALSESHEMNGSVVTKGQFSRSEVTTQQQERLLQDPPLSRSCAGVPQMRLKPARPQRRSDDLSNPRPWPRIVTLTTLPASRRFPPIVRSAAVSELPAIRVGGVRGVRWELIMARRLAIHLC
jgi:hypothetical protein